MALHFWVSGKVFIADSSSDGSVFYWSVLGGTRPRRRSLLWWTLAPMTTLDRHGRQRPRRMENTAPRPYPASREARPSGGAGLSVSVPSFLPPEGLALTCHQCPPFLLPALGHCAVQTAPIQATGVRRLWWTAAPSTSPQTPIIDQSTLKKVNTMQKAMRKGRAAGRATHLPLVTIRHPQAAALSVIRGNEAGGTEGREPSLHVDTKCLLTAPFPPTATTGVAYPLSPECPPCGAAAPRSDGE